MLPVPNRSRTWNSLSKIVQQINQSNLWTATLTSDDAPAVQLCRQTNSGLSMPYECVVSEVGLIGLADSSLPSIAATPSGGLAYQVSEVCCISSHYLIRFLCLH